MKIIDEYTPRCNIPQGIVLSCVLQKCDMLYGVYAKKKELYIFRDDEITVLHTKHGFNKMAYSAQNQFYLMHCSGRRGISGVLYVLDHCFKEIDSIPMHAHKIEDIYFDETLCLIFVVTPYRIQKYNCNGDYLGNFMNTHKKKCYKALCTWGKFIFLAYKKGNCSYVASYHAEGAYLEQISLGCEYAVQNMQVILRNGCPFLRIYAVKHACYPFFIEVELNGRQDALPTFLTHETICVE